MMTYKEAYEMGAYYHVMLMPSESDLTYKEAFWAGFNAAKEIAKAGA